MSTTAFATVPAFEMVLRGKAAVTLGCEIKIAVFYRNDLLHTTKIT